MWKKEIEGEKHNRNTTPKNNQKKTNEKGKKKIFYFKSYFSLKKYR